MEFDRGGEHIRRALSYARLAAVPLWIAGVLHGTAATHLLLFAAVQGPPALVAGIGFGLMAAVHLALGFRVYDASHLATLTAVGAALGGTCLALGWWIFLLIQGTVSLLAVAVCLAGVVSGAACAGLVPLTAASAAAQRRLVG